MEGGSSGNTSTSCLMMMGYGDHENNNNNNGNGNGNGNGNVTICAPPMMMMMPPPPPSLTNNNNAETSSNNILFLPFMDNNNNNPQEDNNSSSSSIKSKIMAHPHYHRLLTAYLNCQKVKFTPPPINTNKKKFIFFSTIQRLYFLTWVLVFLEILMIFSTLKVTLCNNSIKNPENKIMCVKGTVAEKT